MRDTSACQDCVVTVLFGSGLVEDSGPIEIDETERTALDNLAAEGLCPPLRLVPKAG
jgi:hypothetical protein